MSSSTLQPGARLGKYQVLAHIATGGMGSVYKAVDTALGRIVALKVLPSQLGKQNTDLERFRNEARAAASLSHRHIVTFFDLHYDEVLDLHYLAMEFVDGVDLGKHLESKGRLQPEDARRILIQAAQALAHAYSRGVIHRDVKPSNFLLAQTGRKIVVKLTDMGLALIQSDESFKVTREGSTVGTVDYMAPEQARDSRATDIRSDIYSLGCTGFHMLAGKPPFFEGGLGERVYKHMSEPPPDVRQFSPNVSAGFWAVLQKMLAKNPEDRYPTPDALLSALNRTPANASAEQSAALAAQRNTDLEPCPRTPSHPLPTFAEPTPSSGESGKAPSSLDAVPRESSRPLSGSTPTLPTGGNVGPLITPDQAQAALAFYERALQVLAQGGGTEYTRQLLANCLKLDPFNLAYRRTLREVNRKVAGSVLGRLFGKLNVLALKSKMRRARSTGDYRKVLEYGEEILARHPADIGAHVEMARAAEELGLRDLALWLLEQGREQAPKNVVLMRALAQFHEDGKDWKRALELWEQIREQVPDDPDARRKINELSVADHLKRGKYRR